MPGMWVFRPAVGDDPKLASMNMHQGRQTWAWDPDGGTPEQLAAVERARAKFAANRLSQRHSADELLRLQAAEKVRSAAAAGDAPPQPPPAAGSSPLDAASVAGALRGAVGFYQALQCDDGHFPGDYGGPMFLMPGLIITLYTCGVLDEVLPPESHQREMRRYLQNHQNADGGFGLHIEVRVFFFVGFFIFLFFVVCWGVWGALRCAGEDALALHGRLSFAIHLSSPGEN
jgi:cycloartenol synthase